MTAQKSTRKRLTSLLAAGAAALVAISGIALAPTAASAADPVFQSAKLDWGVKESFRNYLLGPIAHGGYELLGTTTASAADLRPTAAHLKWSGGTGSAAANGNSANVSFGTGNGVHFTGHEMQGAHALDMRFTNPRVEISGTTGTLYLDVRSREFIDTTSVSQDFFDETDVPFATLKFSAPARSGNTLTWTNAEATLTQQGEAAFGGFYESGAVLDPVTMTATFSAGSTPPKPLPYRDVKKSDTHYRGINWMFQKSYAAPATYFHPGNAMTRGAFATVMMRMNEPGYQPPASLKLPYSDVKKSDIHYKGIAWMYHKKYAASASKYNPGNPVTRGAMATFLQRMEQRNYTPPANPRLPYSDVKKSDTHYRGIVWMFQNGNAAPANKYNPGNSTTRGAMATFLVRTYG